MSKEFWVEIFMEGRHTSEAGDEGTYDPEFLREAVRSFNELKPEVGFRYDSHAAGAKKITGKVAAVKVVRDKLLAKFTGLSDEAQEKIKRGKFAAVSSAFKLRKRIGEKVVPVVLDHVAILEKVPPAVKGLAPISAYFTEKQGEHGDEVERVYTFERAYLSGNVAGHGGNEENKNHTQPREEATRMENEALKILQEQVANLTRQMGEQTEENRKFAAERDDEKTRADKAEKELKSFTEKASKEKCESTMATAKTFCEAQVKAGKMTPAGSTALLKDLDNQANFTAEGELSIPWENVKAFAEAGIEKLDKGEKGKSNGEGDEKTAGEKLVGMAREFSAKHEVTFAQAMDVVRAENPELSKEELEESLGGDE